MLSPELDRFCTEWLAKAAPYSVSSVDECYDKFFTLFVVFNRLYAEATFELARQGRITLQPNRQLPDRKGATEYAFEIIGIAAFQELCNTRLAGSISEVASLIESEQFYIKLSVPNGERQREKDLALLADLRSSGKTRLLAVLDILYSVRCNLFHGHKAFRPVQVALLRPAIAILSEVIATLRQALSTNVA